MCFRSNRYLTSYRHPLATIKSDYQNLTWTFSSSTWFVSCRAFAISADLVSTAKLFYDRIESFVLRLIALTVICGCHCLTVFWTDWLFTAYYQSPEFQILNQSSKGPGKGYVFCHSSQWRSYSHPTRCGWSISQPTAVGLYWPISFFWVLVEATRCHICAFAVAPLKSEFVIFHFEVLFLTNWYTHPYDWTIIP